MFYCVGAADRRRRGKATMATSILVCAEEVRPGDTIVRNGREVLSIEPVLFGARFRFHFSTGHLDIDRFDDVAVFRFQKRTCTVTDNFGRDFVGTIDVPMAGRLSVHPADGIGVTSLDRRNVSSIVLT